ncbi:MAG: hypothetical protein RI556_00305 [Hydrogenovibrio sp.]|uniref:hypothetical protein n=1 Tax=Hydrogenovibrio sp. TaxID=2065821 RepID=UPI00287072E5|nr:hypothetical protein [Hydrogenovibrio sp.]MDR9497595.1 hypothetical protein [Hydrogenovibrio sp.]
MTSVYRMISLGFGLMLWLFASVVQAQTLPAQSFDDQWGKAQVLDESTQWVVYSHHMDGNDWVKGAFDQLKLSDLSAQHLLYVADISGMPSLVSKWLAIPEMQDYAFPIALVREQSRLQDWPKADEQVSVYRLKQGRIVAEHRFDSREALQVFLSMKVLNDGGG